MTGYELKQHLASEVGEDRFFIKWWRKENDFADYELIDTFLEHLTPASEYENYELLTMDDMWHELQKHASARIWMESRKGKSIVHWQHFGSDGSPREDQYRYSARLLMALFESETHGDTLC